MPSVKKAPPPIVLAAIVSHPVKASRLSPDDVVNPGEEFSAWVQDDRRLADGCLLHHASMTYRAAEGGPGRVLLRVMDEWVVVPEHWVIRGEAPRPIPPRRGEVLSTAAPVNVRIEPDGKLQARMERPRAKDNRQEMRRIEKERDASA